LIVLRQWYAKLLYVIVGVAIYYLGGALAPTDNSRGILRAFLVVVLVLLATRVFRSKSEPDNAPRPLWRMTGRPLAGWVLGVLLGLTALGFVIAGLGIELTPAAHSARGGEPVIVVIAVLFAALAVLYLTSSIRLRSIEREARAAKQSAER
jgi:uncharacterized membrane protein YfcA